MVYNILFCAHSILLLLIRGTAVTFKFQSPVFSLSPPQVYTHDTASYCPTQLLYLCNHSCFRLDLLCLLRLQLDACRQVGGAHKHKGCSVLRHCYSSPFCLVQCNST